MIVINSQCKIFLHIHWLWIKFY